MLKIKDFSILCGCSVYTLRYYDEIGILKPSIINDNSGYRYYDESQVNRYIEIKDFQSIGFSIIEIKGFKNLTDYEIVTLISEKAKNLEEKLELALYVKEKYFGGI